MSITIRSTKENIEKYASEILKDCFQKILVEQDKVVLAIPGGRSVQGIYKKLLEKSIPWDRVHIFMVDERIVSVHDKKSNFRQAHELFIKSLIDNNTLPEKNVHPFIMDTAKEDMGLSQYKKLFLQSGGRLDIALMSSGEDGHVASLFPNHHSVKSDARLFLQVHNAPKLPKRRITMSRLLLSSARCGILLFFGEEKRTAYNLFKSDERDTIFCPAKLALQIKELYVFSDIDC